MLKNLFVLLVVIILLGCSKESNEINSDDLVGSCWYQKKDNYQSYTFYFAINGKCIREWETGIGKSVSTEYKYSYNPPNITIEMLKGGIFAIGYINKDVMYLDGNDINYTLDKVR